MPILFNLLYLTALCVAWPYLLFKMITAGKYRRGLLAKCFGLAPRRGKSGRCVWFHGVSVGEIHMLRRVVAAFRREHPEFTVVVSTTTDTGYDEATKTFPELSVFWWPLDFSWAVRQALHRVRPELVVLGESEIWPNFLTIAHNMQIKTIVVNGRFSPRSARRYQRFAWLLRPVLKRIDAWLMQTDAYADAVRACGVKTVTVTGNVKYEGILTERNNPATNDMARLFRVTSDDLVFVAGSTASPEEVCALQAWQSAREKFPNLRLILVPRQRDRFDEVARILSDAGVAFLRRSELAEPVADRQTVILVDAMGELSAIWGLADVAFVGGSLDGKRGGQNMIEPAAFGAAVMFGPHVWNFRATVDRLLEVDGARQIDNQNEMQSALMELLQDAPGRSAMGDRAKRFVLSQQGATMKSIQILGSNLRSAEQRAAA